jgi:ParB-like chromosome segregation protein Spo0J
MVTTIAEIELRPIDRINPYRQNNKIHSDASVEKLVGLIREFGFDQPIVITPDGEIIKGHRRWLAAKRLGLKQVPTIVRKDLTAAQIKASRIADNATQYDSDYDYGAIAIDLQELMDEDYDLALTGLDDIDDILATVALVEGEAPKEDTSKGMGQRSKLIKLALYVEQIDVVERAIRATGLKNRGEAVVAICRSSLNEDL